MRKLLLSFVVLLAGAVLAAAGVTLNPNVRAEFANCASGGSSSATVYAGQYMMRTFDEEVFVCYAATCASGGERFGASQAFLIVLGSNTTVSCRSASSTGDLIFTRAD